MNSCNEHHCKHDVLFNWKWRGWPGGTCQGEAGDALRAQCPGAAGQLCLALPLALAVSTHRFWALVLLHSQDWPEVKQHHVRLPLLYKWHRQSVQFDPAPLGSPIQLAVTSLFEHIINTKRDSDRGHDASWHWLLHLHRCPLAVTVFYSLQKSCMLFTICCSVKSKHILQEVDQLT